jgi:predicted regulator of Ras-like GTPase activity (Roadblock/LC7/MglB family)
VFKNILRGILNRVEGAVAISLIGLDGIAIESISENGIALDVVGAELGSFIKSIRVSNTDFNTGDVLQFALVTEKYITFLSAVTPDYFVLLILRPDGNYGRARFELGKAKLSLRDELG